MNLKKHPLLKAGLFSTIARFVGVGLNFAVVILLTRTLSQAEAGMILMLMTLVTGVALFSRLGVEQWIVREVARLHDSDKHQHSTYLTHAYHLTLLGSLGFMVLWLLALPWLETWFFDDAIKREWLGWAVLGIPAFNLLLVNASFLKAIQQTANSILLQNALPAITYLILLLVFWEGYQHNQYFLALYTGSLLLAGMVSLYWLRPWWNGVRSVFVQTKQISTVFKESIALAPVSFFSFLMLWADTLFIGWYLNNADIALFGVAARLSFISLFFLGALDATIYPRLLKIQKHEPDKLVRFFWQSTGLVAAVLGVVTLSLLIIGEFILWVFKPEYIAASTTLGILLVAQFARALSLTFSFMFIMQNQVRYLNMFLGIALIVNIIANITLIPHYGIEGAAGATLSANFVLTAGVVWLFFKNKLLSADAIA